MRCRQKQSRMSLFTDPFFSAVERYGSLLLFLLSTAVLSRLLDAETNSEFSRYQRGSRCHFCVIPRIWRRQLPHTKKSSFRTKHQDGIHITFGISIAVGLTLFTCSDAPRPVF